MLPDAYGCAVENRFGNLLDDDADPFDLISELEREKEKKKKKKKKQDEEKKVKQKKPGQKESQRDRRVRAVHQDPVSVCKQQTQQSCPGPASESRDGKEETLRGMKRAAAVEHMADQREYPQEFSVFVPIHADSELRGRGGNRRRGGRGGGYTRNLDTVNLRGKREFERHNGTGVSPEEKRGGRGPWNWGCVDEAAIELMEVMDNTATKAEEPETPVDDENPSRMVGEEDGEMVVQVAVQMSLDEWKAMREMNRPKMEFNIRKAEDKIPSKAKVIHKSKQVENLKFMEAMETEGNFFRKSVNDITSLLDINFGSLVRPARGGRGRGGRGGVASRPEKVKPIVERDSELAPNPDDPEDFPVLSARR
ncbi:intracellular hyaluronan-binding protein 4-like isoform X2 [Cynoglossus semilaevis]|uniref:Intracellular hyaluronan-binding protein 4-like n=1 Tax=Cynoglossus semilaevis TaxID=244447 RepID=A0A3P8VPJ6_CYNSE|nr:intracellular hyaluronan-binding protein 4-like isoform X1 [Cynoglossus semilaevis]XP_008333525.1 intracellular hyaluronan-binding protein 4-like isoform X2 [Cynoglossus semilaevis]